MTVGLYPVSNLRHQFASQLNWHGRGCLGDVLMDAWVVRVGQLPDDREHPFRSEWGHSCQITRGCPCWVPDVVAFCFH